MTSRTTIRLNEREGEGWVEGADSIVHQSMHSGQYDVSVMYIICVDLCLYVPLCVCVCVCVRCGWIAYACANDRDVDVQCPSNRRRRVAFSTVERLQHTVMRSLHLRVDGGVDECHPWVPSDGAATDPYRHRSDIVASNRIIQSQIRRELFVCLNSITSR